MRFFTAVLLLVLAGTQCLRAQLNPLQTGYDLLAGNQVQQARDYFARQVDGQAAGDAVIALSFTEMMLDNGPEATAAFIRFAALEKNETKRNAYLDAVWSAGHSEMGEQQLAFTEQQTQNNYSRLSPLAYYALGEHYYLSGNLKKSREYFGRIGAVNTWSVTGPFENISESGFDRDFGVLAQPRAEATFTNKLGVPVSWFPVAQTDRHGWLHFGNHMTTSNSVVYAQTFARSDKRQDVVFRLGSSGSVKVWVNDRLVFSEFHERDNHLDTYRFGAELEEGYNRILIQVGATTQTGSNFMLRMTDAEGELIPGLTYSGETQTYPKKKGEKIEAYDNPTVAYFESLLDKGTANYIDYLSLGQFYFLNGHHVEAKAVLTEALDRYPGNHHIISQLIPLLRAMDDETGASELEQRLLVDAPDHKLSLNKRMQEARNLEDWPLYEELLQTYKAKYGESETTLGHELILAGGRSETEKARSLIEAGYRKYPSSDDVVIGLATIQSGVRQQHKDAIKTLEKFLKKHYRESVVEKLIDLRLKAGEPAEALKLFNLLLEYDPVSVNTYSRLSRLYYLLGNYRQSQVMLDKALAIAPYSGSLYSSQADIYTEADDKERAEAAYTKALSLNPYDYDSRDALRNLRSEAASAFAALPETDYYALYANSKSAEAYPDDHSVILAYDVQQIVHDGGANETRTSLLVKVLNPEGVDFWKEYSIPIYGNQQGNVEKVEVLDPDGTRHDASRSGADIVFDRLQAGGAIHLVYRVQDYQHGRLSGKFWNEHPLTMGFPSGQSTYSLLVPAGMKFHTKITGMEHRDIQPKRSKVNGKDLYVWQLKDQAGLLAEAVTPDFDDILTTVRVSNIEDWAFIAQWYSELTHAKVRVDETVREAVAELFADAPERMTKRQEVQRIYEFVAGNIRYISVPFLQSNYIPQSAAKTLATRQGDCKDVSSLFVAMCDVRGIEANLVLINTRDRSVQNLSLPGIGFNHCIARVELDGDQYYVELTDENLPFGTGDWSVNNAFAVAIPRRGGAFDGTAGRINPSSRGVNATIRKGKVTFDGNDVIFALDNRQVNSVASTYRHQYRNESQDNRNRYMQEAISGGYPRVELTDLQFGDDLDDLSSNQVSYHYAYRVADPGNKIGGMLIYPLILSDRMEAQPYTTTEERKLPIDLWQTFQAEYYEETLEVINPEGKKLVEVPESIQVSNDFIDYAIEFTPTEDGLRILRTLLLKKDVVAPEYYTDFREDMFRIVEADKVNLAYK
ncbi:DUF3857 domain-containing protein [Lewinella sp. IMCC34191]|uniref:DUF3857 domain-containing protein n=1 Tax=Lewinella sp. IMCC34191 TaxID=2259172 RepID=UPI000E27A567|nr:DUF3857 domain-containing protein [Lewinella sp. IMCC34191]